MVSGLDSFSLVIRLGVDFCVWNYKNEDKNTCSTTRNPLDDSDKIFFKKNENVSFLWDPFVLGQSIPGPLFRLVCFVLWYRRNLIVLDPCQKAQKGVVAVAKCSGILEMFSIFVSQRLGQRLC